MKNLDPFAIHPKNLFDFLTISVAVIGILLINSPLVDWQNKNPSEIFAQRTGSSLVLAALVAFLTMEIRDRDPE